MRRSIPSMLLLLVLGMSTAPVFAAEIKAPTPADASSCHVATYRLTDGTLVDVAPEAQFLRWRTLDGRVGRLERRANGQWISTLGWTNNTDGVIAKFGACGQGTILFGGMSGKTVALNIREVSFASGGETLAGRLVLPEGNAKVPVIVLGHGSEKTSMLENGFRQRLYPAVGVGVFVFDKRGTGKSTGKYTQDFEILASDMVSAMQKARSLVGDRGARFGYLGGSQAGWILPLAATKTPVDFVIVGYGIAATPLIEDRTETLQDLVAAGWGPDVLAKAAEVTDATAAVISSRFTDGYERFNAVVAKYKNEPWFKDLDGEFTGEMVKYSEEQLRVGGPQQDDGTTWTFDAVGTLANVTAPLLWMIAGSDTEGAGEETSANLRKLKADGRPITIALFPNTEHGIHEIRLSPKGERQETRYSPDYFRMELDFARHGRLTTPYEAIQLL